MKKKLTSVLLGARTRSHGATPNEAGFTAGRADASLVPDSIDEEARTIELVMTTGQAGKRHHWDIGEYMEELEVSRSAIRTERLDKGLSVCDNHDTYTGAKGVYGVTIPTVSGNILFKNSGVRPRFTLYAIINR